jgi:hypothetical protein
LELASTVDHIYATKGKAVVYIDMKREKPADATLTDLLLGPTGNLRAPTLRIERTLVVGFDPSTYQKVFE